ncbi:MAG: protein translocase subunit SecF, partial [Spirochaetales bacterium]|nr:protein translocase subunit SecF [Spirochaetales bacterium]
SNDFQAVLSKRVQITDEALTVSYEGSEDVSLNIVGGVVQVTVRGSEGVVTKVFSQDTFRTIGDLAKGLRTITGVSASVVGNSAAPISEIITGLSLPYNLSEIPVTLTVANSDTLNFISIEEMRTLLRSIDIAQVQVVGTDYRQEFQIRATAKTEGSKDDLENSIRTTLRNAYGSNNVIVKGSDYVGPKFSAALSTSAVLLVVVSLVLIMLYIWFRFKFAYAVSALTALVHDILIMLGFIAVAQLEVSTTTIAAVLTIIGYSLNDTIVVFDRIRENTQSMKGGSVERVINKSINQSLSRTIMTSLTTLFAVIPLFIFATGSIKLFALNLIVGIIVGTYSSIFIASPILLAMLRRQRTRKAVHLGKTDTEGKDEVSKAAIGDGSQPKAEPKEVEIPKIERKKRGKRKTKK